MDLVTRALQSLTGTSIPIEYVGFKPYFYVYMITLTEIALRLVAAALLGSIVGFERQRREWTAGLRTHMLVCVGSALAMIVSIHGFGDVVGKPGIGLDPSRVAAQVISGIGFLGAGTILFMKNQVIRGLTTAAGLWTVAGVGLAVGGGLYFAAAVTIFIVLIILAVIKPIETRVFKKDKYNAIKLVVKRSQVDLSHIEKVLAKHQITINEVRIAPAFDDNGDNDEVSIFIQKLATKKENALTIIEDIRRQPAVNSVEFFAR